MEMQYIAALKAHATPIDFENLESEGLLVKKGNWYQVTNIHKLPDHVAEQITEQKHDKKGNFFVKLPASWEEAQKTFKEKTGKEYFE